MTTQDLKRPDAGRFRLTSLDVALGMLYGADPDAEALRAGPSAPPPPRQVLEDVVRSALLRSPCVVSFSGGRDSSAVLALAVHVARRDGLPLPVPVSLRFPEDDASDESEWQESVVRHLRLDDWVRLTFTDELDLLGPYARDVLRRHGVLWPPNAHFHAPVAAQARGGTVLTGFGGDEVLGAWPYHRAFAVLAQQAPLRPRDPLRIVSALTPGRARYLSLTREARVAAARPWLTAEGAREARRLWLRMATRISNRWDVEIVRNFARSRYVGAVRASLATVAADAGAAVVHPLSDPRFLLSAAHHVGPQGFRHRALALQELVGDLLPDGTRTRLSKAGFMQTFWNVHARDFAATWDGSGVDRRLVDPAMLSVQWDSPAPDARSFTVLQAAWLAADGS